MMSRRNFLAFQGLGILLIVTAFLGAGILQAWTLVLQVSGLLLLLVSLYLKHDVDKTMMPKIDKDVLQIVTGHEQVMKKEVLDVVTQHEQAIKRLETEHIKTVIPIQKAYEEAIKNLTLKSKKEEYAEQDKVRNHELKVRDYDIKSHENTMDKARFYKEMKELKYDFDKESRQKENLHEITLLNKKYEHEKGHRQTVHEQMLSRREQEYVIELAREKLKNEQKEAHRKEQKERKEAQRKWKNDRAEQARQDNQALIQLLNNTQRQDPRFEPPPNGQTGSVDSENKVDDQPEEKKVQQDTMPDE